MEQEIMMAAKFLAAGIATVGIGGVGVGMGRLVASGLEAIGRNPSAVGEIQKFAILGIAFTEALALFILFVVLLVLFAV